MENIRDRAAEGNGQNLVERRKATQRTLTAILFQMTAILQGVNTTQRGRMYRTINDGTADARATADTWPNDLMPPAEESPPTMPNPYTSIRKNASSFQTTPACGRQRVMWVWDDECQKAFTSLKESLTTHPTLHLYQEGLPCQVYCNASTLGIAGVLKQVYPDGKTYTVQNFSRSLRAHERSYSNLELQCLAIVESVDNFRACLMGRKFTIFSDHPALQWLKGIKAPSGRFTESGARRGRDHFGVIPIRSTLQISHEGHACPNTSTKCHNCCKKAGAVFEQLNHYATSWACPLVKAKLAQLTKNA
ncbi:hypothetical protein LAZ67_9001963 [Cordylochernes scorpioides]|uniref:Reverse transcriptase/retrotransposon-derived protein RNase H-like domain-containing protein n=1 Tax=Cordylochernes scorpioides TaxID=51811 RepID=A0ABY6KTG2_9ARAC|nr:hypothetical protein LAZ67_9001963 [Cordylochernes scorpioides]